MADVAKRPAADDAGSIGGGQLVKRQRTQETALIVGSVTKDVSDCLCAGSPSRLQLQQTHSDLGEQQQQRRAGYLP